MATSQSSEVNRSESPDPASHAANIYDAANDEVASEDDDDNYEPMTDEPTTDESEDAEFFDPTEDVEADFHDAEDGMSGVEIEFSVEGDEAGIQDEDAGNETVTEEIQAPPLAGTRRPSRIQGERSRGMIAVKIETRTVPAQIMQLLGHAGLRRIFANHRAGGGGITLDLDEEDNDDNDDPDTDGTRRLGGAGGREVSTAGTAISAWNDGAEDDEGEPRMGLRVDQRLEMDDDLYDNPRSPDGRLSSHTRSRLRSRRVAAAAAAADEDEDEDDGASPW
ncbi:hypothetical protein P7C71_g4678, partial [Lecanoromycetidae sp. Uapishka_2]